MNRIVLLLTLLAFAISLALFAGCDGPGKPEPRVDAPGEFYQPAGPIQPRPQARMQLPEYRLNFGDELEIIYQVQHNLQPQAYTIQIEDRINIRFPFQPELNQTLQVPSDGTLNLLLLDQPVKVVGKTAEALSAELRRLYKDQIQNPQLTVQVESANVKVEELKRAITTSPRGQSRLIPVRPDGRISLPYIGDAMAFGLTVEQLHQNLNTQYRDAGIEGIEVSVNILNVAPIKVYVLGEVNRPGLLNLRHHATLTQAIGAAGGWIRGRSEAEKVLLVRRRGMAVPTGAVINVKYLTQGLGDQATREKPVDYAAYRFDPYLQDDDIIYVPSTQLAKNADWIRIVFTEGIYRVVPWSTTTTYSIDDSVDWLRPNPSP